MNRPRLMRLIRWRVWLAGAIRPTETQVTLFWAGVVGLLGGLSSCGFRVCIRGLQWLMTQQGGSLVQAASNLAWWERLAVPTAGGFLAGAVLFLGMRITRGEHSTDYMEAIALRDGIIRTRSSLVKSVSSLLTIASGGSIGREGSMVQLGAWLASFVGRRVRLPTPRLRLLVACGAAAGIAAAYNAPIAGALFVAEIILGSISMESFGPLIFASVVSTLTVRKLWTGSPLFAVPSFQLVSAWELIPCLALGLLAGLVAPGFLRLLRMSEDLFARSRLPVYWRLAVGGLIVGGLSVYVPQVWGNGYSVIDSILHNPWPWGLVLAVLGCKVVSTAATFGSGATGGVFTPTLFVGAALGCLYGQGLHALAPETTAPPSAYALVGMGYLLAATTHAPLMAILMLFEMTLDYDIILPLMLGCVAAFYVARRIEPESIYSHSLRRKDVTAPPSALPEIRVRNLMKPAPPTVREEATFAEIAQYFLTTSRNTLYVVGPGNEFRGAIELHLIKAYLTSESLATVLTASDLMRAEFPWVTEDALLSATLGRFANLAAERLPVVNSAAERKLVGTLAKTDVILTLAHGGPPSGPLRSAT